MLFRRHDAAAPTNALNGLFDADAVVIGGRGGLPGSEPCLPHRSQRPAASVSQPAHPANQPGSPARKQPAPAMPTPAMPPAARYSSGPAARVWASWVVSRAVSA